MFRVGLTIVLPLILPTGLYLLWIAALGAPRDSAASASTASHAHGTAQQGSYVAPRWQNGRIIPGHIEPATRP